VTRTASGASARLPLTVALTFAVAYLPLQALQVAGAVYLPAYFATMGIGLVAVGTAFGIVRLIDVPIEFVLGVSMDRTRTRFGRYRIWLAAGAPLFMLGLYMLLRAGPAGGMAYLIVWLLVMYLGVSIMMLAHQAWTATLAKSYAERARLFGVILGVGISGAVSVLAIPIVMEELGRTDAEGVRAMMWYLIGITPFAIGLALWRTPETITPDEPGQRFRWRDYLDLVLDRNMLRILLADLSLSLGPTWMSALYIFFSRDVMGFTAGQAGILLLVYIMAGVAGAPTLGWLATKISKHRTVMLAAASYSLLLMTLPFLPKGVLLAALPTLFLTGFMAAGFNVPTSPTRCACGRARSGAGCSTR
jgi:glycoside/pentoside/hexuronide:cation symporter, GPH family